MNKLIEPIYELLRERSRWIKGSMAINSRGESVPSKSPEAACWCLVGALNKCYTTEKIDDFRYYTATRELLERRVGDIISFNDAVETQHEDVLKLLEGIE